MAYAAMCLAVLQQAAKLLILERSSKYIAPLSVQDEGGARGATCFCCPFGAASTFRNNGRTRLPSNQKYFILLTWQFLRSQNCCKKDCEVIF